MPISAGGAIRTRGITFMHEREVTAIVSEDTRTERAARFTTPHPPTFGHMTDQELLALHGDALQVVSFDEREKDARVIQGRPVGKLHSTRIGSGWHGKNIRLSFHQPQRSDTLSGIDTATGESIFSAAQQTERVSRGKIHAHDFPTRSKKTTVMETDHTNISGIHLNHLKRTQRAHWSSAETKEPRVRPKRQTISADDVPWDAPTNPPNNGRYVIR